MIVLFVEDDPMNRLVVRDMLAVVDVEMAEAIDAESGLRMIDANNYDVVLMDLRMPDMDGLTAIRHVRARSDDKAEVPIIVVTADGAPNLLQRCKALDINHVLSKPVSMEKLFATLGEVIANAAEMIE